MSDVKNKKNEKMQELVKILKQCGISTIDANTSYAQRALDDFDKLEMERYLHDEDKPVGRSGIIESGIHIEGRLLKNANINKVVNELKKLKCWVEADRKETWSTDGSLNGRWFIYHKADKDEDVMSIVKAKVEFKDKYMHDVCLAISKLM